MCVGRIQMALQDCINVTLIMRQQGRLKYRFPEELDGGTQRANVSLQVYRSKLCSREFPAETLSLRRRAEQLPGLKEGQRDRITVVTAVTCSLAGRQNEPPHPTPQLRRLAAVNPLFTVDASFNSVAQTTFPQQGSRKRLCFGQREVV
ncbi:hypothetical protein CRENBAI_006295 [Crenichthys baileyi]|uniref:Uncharacterized protein n=1 Tax=Crenichthys baileyi TaxID=28760 RepID=A0AAV9RSV4_9TELE